MAGSDTQANGKQLTGMGDPQADSALAEANLHRMRGQWPAAEARCIEVMRADPNNVHAHSLLGDIYRDQGRFEDAAQWYRLALDLNPESAADRTKLAHVEQQQARLAVDTPSPGVDTPGVGTQKLLGLPPTTWVNGATAAAVVFIVLIVGLVLFRPWQPASQTAGASISGTIPGSKTGSVGPPLPGRAAPGSSAAVHPQGVSAGAAGDAPPPVAGAYTSKEQAILIYLTSQSGIGADTLVGPVTLDPRGQHATIVLTYRRPSATPEALRREVLRLAAAAAQGAFTVDPNVQRATLSVRYGGSGRTAEPAFSGEAVRAAIQALAANATEYQVASAFTSVWWAPAIAPGSAEPAPQDQGVGQ